jgi:hypothetical protein
MVVLVLISLFFLVVGVCSPLQVKPHVKVENNGPSIAEYDGNFFFS